MNRLKTNFILLLLIASHFPQHLQADLISSASESCQKIWGSTKNLFNNTVESISSPKKEDPRIYILSAFGLLTGCLGLWIIKKGIDALSADKLKLLPQQAGQHQHDLSRGLLTTALGILCATTGIVLITTSKPIIRSMK